MDYKTKVKPSKASSITLIIFGVLFLIFGVVFLISVSSELSSDDGGPLIITFFAIWMIMCLGFVVFGIMNLVKKDGISTYEFDINKVDSAANQDVSNVEQRLRNLDALKQKRLITDEEYQNKRKQIIDNEL